MERKTLVRLQESNLQRIVLLREPSGTYCHPVCPPDGKRKGNVTTNAAGSPNVQGCCGSALHGKAGLYASVAFL